MSKENEWVIYRWGKYVQLWYPLFDGSPHVPASLEYALQILRSEREIHPDINVQARNIKTGEVIPGEIF